MQTLKGYKKAQHEAKHIWPLVSPLWESVAIAASSPDPGAATAVHVFILLCVQEELLLVWSGGWQ